MIKKLVAHGNSAALVLDKPILEILKVTMDTPLEITTDGRNLIISPADNPQREKKIKKALTKINKLHKKVLKRLADK